MKYSLLTALLLFIGLCLTDQSCQGIKAKSITENRARPNVLFLFADDQRADALGAYGNPYILSPNMDKLSGEGVRFSNAYVMGGHHGAICAPSRVMVMTGKSLFHAYEKYDMNNWVENIVLDGVTTMPMYFARHGYETFGTGKWHNGANSFEASFQKGNNVFLGGMCDHFSVLCRKLGPDGNLSEPVNKSYSTDLFADAAIDYLNEYSKTNREKPFFSYVSFTAPHDPRSPREDYVDMYPDGTVPVPGNFKKYHPFAFDNMQIRDENLASWPRTPEIIQKSLSDYYALISHLDNRVGDILETLKKEGLYENTIIVYAADNGLAIGSHGLLGKQNLYEHSTKVPLIISGPGIPKGKTSDALVYLYDLFPTLSELCGLPLPGNVDGMDVSQVIKGEMEGVRTSLFTTYRNTVRAVRTDEWKLIRYPALDYSQLFNLINDPLEINNLADLPENNEKVHEMMELLEVWQNKTADTTSLTASTILPKEFDISGLKQERDVFQPDYILKRYFTDKD